MDVPTEWLVNSAPTDRLQREREARLRAQGDYRISLDERFHLQQEVAELNRRIAIALARDAVQEERAEAHADDPAYEGCYCLGTGVPPYVWGRTVQSERWCTCPDGIAARDAHRAGLVAELEATRPARVAQMVEGVMLPDWMRQHTMGTLLQRATPVQAKVIHRIREAAAGEPRSIILYGKRGTGKSWLAGWLAATWVHRVARPARFWPAIDLMNEMLRQMHEEIGAEGDVYWSAGRVPILVLDDADKLRLTTETQKERIYGLANARSNGRTNGLVTIITMNCTVDEWAEKVDGWVSDRFVELCGGLHGGWVIEMPEDARNMRTDP